MGETFTKKGYQYIRTLMLLFRKHNISSWCAERVCTHEMQFSHSEINVQSFLPYYSHLHNNLQQRLLEHFSPNFKENYECVYLCKAGARENISSQLSSPAAFVRTILSNDYARAYVSSLFAWSEMYSTSLAAQDGTT